MTRITNKSIKFAFDREKAIQAILWLLGRNNGTMDKLKLVKLFFLADREHLARYGRPIVGGNYYTMDFGPVSSELYDLVKEKDTGLPFTTEKTDYQIRANGVPDQRRLSKSDLDILDEIYSHYGHMDKFILVDMTHELKAYKKNEPAKGTRNQLPYEDFFLDLDAKSQEMLKIIHDEQEAWADFT
ncbi:MAG: Panacea domain-containing protein [Planctomycetota bacterium]